MPFHTVFWPAHFDRKRQSDSGLELERYGGMRDEHGIGSYWLFQITDPNKKISHSHPGENVGSRVEVLYSISLAAVQYFVNQSKEWFITKVLIYLLTLPVLGSKHGTGSYHPILRSSWKISYLQKICFSVLPTNLAKATVLI